MRIRKLRELYLGPLLWPLLLLAVAFSLPGCGSDAETVVEVPMPPVVLLPVSVLDVEERIEATGQLLARNRAAIASEVAGRITRIVFDEGQAVEEGDVILEVDPERRQLELASARARLSESQSALREREREHGRVVTLHQQQIAAQARLDDAKTQRDRSRAQLAAVRAELQIAERALRDASVRAPFSGTIARRHVSRGEFVNVGVPLMDLVALDPIEVEFHVSERDSGRIVHAQEVLVSVDPYPDELFGATVTVISPTIDERTRTLRVLARLDNPDGRLRPGLFARADLGVTLRPDVILVPEEAVLQRADGAIVYRLGRDHRVERVGVEIGVHRQGLVEVRKGLRREDLVATRGHASLANGKRVSPRNPDGTPLTGHLADARGPAAVATP